MVTIQATDLTKSYGKFVAVNSINFEVHRGEVFGILGPNGAGKSTTISMIVGLLKPTSGKLKVFGHDMPKKKNEVLDKIGFVPQDLVFYDHLTVYENLKLFATMNKVKSSSNIQKAISLMGLEEMKTQISSTLSGGQKRRLNVAIGLLNSPDLLILDEPSAGMDPQSRNVLWESIKQMADEDLTIILCTHLMETADQLSDRICIIDHGRIQTIDTPDNLKKRMGYGDTLEVTTSHSLDQQSLDQLSALISNYDSSSQFHKIDDKLFTITISDGIEAISELVPPMKTIIGHSRIDRISLRDNTLEDVFIELTGRSLRE